jgi:hypothetical protein
MKPNTQHPKKTIRNAIGQDSTPQQYPDYDEETGEMNWNPYQRP